MADLIITLVEDTIIKKHYPNVEELLSEFSGYTTQTIDNKIYHCLCVDIDYMTWMHEVDDSTYWQEIRVSNPPKYFKICSLIDWLKANATHWNMSI